MHPDDFLDSARRAFAPLAERYGFRELGVPSDTYVLKAIVFSNGERAVRFSLDVRDGYLDALYSSASVYQPDGSLAEPVIQSVAERWSVAALLEPEGVDWATRETGLFEPGVLEKAVSDLIAGMERHSGEVFGRAA